MKEVERMVADAIAENLNGFIGKPCDDESKEKIQKAVKELVKGLPKRDFVVENVEVKDDGRVELLIKLVERGAEDKEDADGES